jgi:hypothetical protein
MTATALIAAFTAIIHSTAVAGAAGGIAKHVGPVLIDIAADQVKQVMANPNGDLTQAQHVLATIQEQYNRFADHQS